MGPIENELPVERRVALPLKLALLPALFAAGLAFALVAGGVWWLLIHGRIAANPDDASNRGSAQAIPLSLDSKYASETDQVKQEKHPRVPYSGASHAPTVAARAEAGRKPEQRIPKAQFVAAPISALPTPPPTTPSPANQGTAGAYNPTIRSDGKRIVALDIGRTRLDPGALSATGVPEFEFNKCIVELVKQRLEKKDVAEPFVINPVGGPITLPERTRLAAEAGASIFVAVHHDSVADKYLQTQKIAGKNQFYSDRFEGYGVFISRKNPGFDASLALARLIGAELGRNIPFAPHHNEPIPGENRPILDAEHGVYQYDDLIVLKTALMPAVLLECGVIANRQQELLLRQPAMQKIIADAIATGIEGYFTKEP